VQEYDGWSVDRLGWRLGRRIAGRRNVGFVLFQLSFAAFSSPKRLSQVTASVGGLSSSWAASAFGIWQVQSTYTREPERARRAAAELES
jgi:hypothetical protein